MGRRIEIADFVHDLRLWLQSAETVGKANGDEQLLPISGRKYKGLEAPEGRRASPHVQHDIEDRAADHPHDLVLSERRNLEVQAANGAPLDGKSLIVLHEVQINADLGQTASAVGLGKETAFVRVLGGH